MGETREGAKPKDRTSARETAGEARKGVATDAGSAPHDVRIYAPRGAQHEVELPLVGFHHGDAAAVPHRGDPRPDERPVPLGAE